MKVNLWHFYHAYAPKDKEDVWLPIVNEHVNILHSSNLASKLNKVYIGVVGTKKNADKISALFKTKNIEHEICAINDTGWEQVTLNKLHEFSFENGGYVLYAHTKGASHLSGAKDSHRRTMNEHLIEKWLLNVELLSNGFCASGIFFLGGSPEYANKEPLPKESNPKIKRHKGFFAGNFWWCNLEYMKNMGYPSMENRIKAEAWMNNLCNSTNLSEYMVYDMLAGESHEVLTKITTR